MSKKKLPTEKKFLIYFETTIYGTKEIEAWDEEDAREQFCVDSIYDYDDGGIRNAEITDIVEVKPRRKGKK